MRRREDRMREGVRVVKRMVMLTGKRKENNEVKGEWLKKRKTRKEKG